MLRAGTGAAEVMLRDYDDRLHHGVALLAGVGNNGGDAYILAAQLARVGVQARLHAVAPPRTPDAQRAAALAAPSLIHGAPTGRELLVVDGLLGTAHHGALRHPVLHACAQLQHARDRHATIVALDLPSGLDATTGEVAPGAVPADVTVTFGTIKRGLLIARGHAGRVVLVDIGLVEHALYDTQRDDRAWRMPDASALAHLVPPVAWNAHKGTRGHVALVGGGAGMAGALVLATRGALGAGCGLAHGYLESPAGVAALQQVLPQAIAHVWPADDEDHASAAGAAPWGHALVLGPGLGRSTASQQMVHRALRDNAGVPLLLDADALTLLATQELSPDIARDSASDTAPDTAPEWAHRSAVSDAAARLRVIASRAAGVVCTPHVGEFARMTGARVGDDWQQRADRLQDFAMRAGVTVLLKGTPTLIATPDSAPLTVLSEGTALLATGGSGDILSGIIGALLAQGMSAPDAAALGATAHGRAAELATRRHGGVRGLTLEDMLDALAQTWYSLQQPASFEPGVLHELHAPIG